MITYLCYNSSNNLFSIYISNYLNKLSIYIKITSFAKKKYA